MIRKEVIAKDSSGIDILGNVQVTSMPLHLQASTRVKGGGFEPWSRCSDSIQDCMASSVGLVFFLACFE